MAGPAPALAPLPPFAQKLLRLIGRLVASKAHARVIVTIRDGKVQYIGLDQTFTPENMPE
jgi:hypothetical protein